MRQACHTENLRMSIVLTLMLVAFNVAIYSQPNPAEEIFAEAKSLATNSETITQSFAKFDEAAALFRDEKQVAKLKQVEYEHGSALRKHALSLMNAESFAEAEAFFNRALDKFRIVDDRTELAFTYHDLGFISGNLGQTNDAIRHYNSALEMYRAIGDRNGEAGILRNLGLVSFNQKKYPEARQYFEAALKIRSELNNASGVADLQVSVGDLLSAENKKLEALTWYATAAGTYRKQKDSANEAATLYKLGTLQAELFKYADSVGTLATALGLFEAGGNEGGAAETLTAIGRVHMGNGKFIEAERALKTAADIFKRLKDPVNESTALLNAAINYLSLDRVDESRIAAERALAGFRESKHELGQAYALLSLTDVHAYLNQHDEAMAKILAARKIFEKIDPEKAEQRVAMAMSGYYYSLANHGEAIRYLHTALRLAALEKDESSEATIYVALANSYSALGNMDRAIEQTEKALAAFRQQGNRYMETVCLNNIGYSNLKLKNYPAAKDFLSRAIALMRTEGYERLDGYATHNLGLVHYAQKDYQLALKNYDYALALYRKTGDRRPESFIYDSYGEVYRDLGQYDRAIEEFQKAIVLAREIRYSEIEAQALGNMMTLWTKRRQPRLAILYGKQAVNVYQTMRATNRSAEKSAQKSFVQSNEKTYRALANVLIEEGRLAEAQQVLDLLKAEEYFEFVRRDSAEADEHSSLALNESERKALEEYSRVSANLTSLGAQFQVLQDRRNKSGGKLPEAEEAEYVRLKAQIEAAGEGLKTFFTRLAAEFSKKVEDGTVVTPQSIETLRADLRRAGPDVVLVSTYLLPERYRAIVTTGRTMVDRKVDYAALKLSGADINRKIFEFQRALQTPNVDPRKIGKELYDIFVKPLEKDLEGAGAKTILWSLDGSLRYIPIAALSPDGKTYLAERYQNVVVTLGRQTNLFVRPTTDEWRAIGAGVSKQHVGFSALPSVPAEIDSIVREQDQSTGVLDGTQMLDEEFNLESFRITVPQQTEDGKPFNVLHLATHFSLGANDQDSALLLGDGTRLSLFEIGRDEALDFKDVELLTLSACQTGVSTGDANGREVESLGMLAQKKGAKAVLATLWKVADESTALFMAEFYKIKKANPTMNKAEAIRLAQKAMIDGRIKSTGTSTACRAEQFGSGAKKDEFKCDPNAPYSHPYFWSPFVLIGNWR